MSREAMNYFIVGGVGLEPTCPAGSGFTGRRANQLLNPPKTFVGLREFLLLSGLPPKLKAPAYKIKLAGIILYAFHRMNILTAINI